MNDINLNNELNVVYIGPDTFPLGAATTKRRRYMVDYMNSKEIQSHVLVTRSAKLDKENDIDGQYGLCDYHNISHHFHSSYFSYLKAGKRWLRQWRDDRKKNILIFPTILDVVDYPFFSYAKKLGYKIVFDQVETSYTAKGTTTSLKRKLHVFINELIAHRAYNNCNGSFVISEALRIQNEKKYPKMHLGLLPNSTPILRKEKKVSFSTIPRILYAGTYAQKDGVVYLIKAFLKVISDGYNCKLILTGKGRDCDMKVLNLVKDNPNVEYLGRVSDERLNEVLLSSDILTMTRENSRFANCGFPFKLSEYLATGNVVLATKVSDVGIYLKHLENAYLVEPENIDQIASGIEYLISNQNKAVEMGEKGLDVAKLSFGIDNVGYKFVNFLQSI